MDDLDPKHRPVEGAERGGEAASALGGDSGGRGGEHGVRGGSSSDREDSGGGREDRGTRWVETTRGILSYSELAPFLAEQVARLEAEVYREAFAARPLEESLLLEFHGRICGDLIPEWGGRWRTIEVRVGNLRPPAAFAVAQQAREYCLNLQARFPDAARAVSELTLEFLSFAEGRFLSIHPFADFNGRTIRVFLLELLRRLDLPRVPLAAPAGKKRADYFAALEAADQNDWRALMEIWRRRFSNLDQG